jgi:hypothetical protein
VEFFRNGVRLAPGDTSAPYEIFVPGNSAFTAHARVVDNHGNLGVSAAVQANPSSGGGAAER